MNFILSIYNLSVYYLKNKERTTFISNNNTKPDCPSNGLPNDTIIQSD